MKVTITKINKVERTAKATGKPFTSLGLQTKEHGEKWLSGFDGKQTANWKVGDTVEIDLVQKGDYLNFSVPKLPEGYAMGSSEVMNELTIIKQMLGRIISLQEGRKEAPPYHYPTPEEEGLDLDRP